MAWKTLWNSANFPYMRKLQYRLKYSFIFNAGIFSNDNSGCFHFCIQKRMYNKLIMTKIPGQDGMHTIKPNGWRQKRSKYKPDLHLSLCVKGRSFWSTHSFFNRFFEKYNPGYEQIFPPKKDEQQIAWDKTPRPGCNAHAWVADVKKNLEHTPVFSSHFFMPA